ncbi:MAG: ASPIC/UnbV domain-containing protein [Saprospiraceae bacterium]|nr:ASPIC/UnbV domain-containing protein [Saprospiraceae bacterium]
MDLITTSVGDEYALVYRNNQDKQANNFISLSLKGPSKNINGIGARVKVYVGNQIFIKDQQPSRGFQSSMDNRLYFGLGKRVRLILSQYFGLKAKSKK